MAAAKPTKKENAPVKKGKQYFMYKVFDVQGNSLKRKNKTCPKCSVFMANHPNRSTCGKCGYTEMKKQ